MRLYPETLPPEQRDLPAWTLWKKETRDGKPAKEALAERKAMGGAIR
jgi:primase-polymerase (primpol)-like protein